MPEHAYYNFPGLKVKLINPHILEAENIKDFKIYFGGQIT